MGQTDFISVRMFYSSAEWVVTIRSSGDDKGIIKQE